MRNRRTWRESVAVVALMAGFLFLAAFADAAEFVWVERGAVSVPIVVAEDAGDETALAAEALADFVEKITGARPEVIAASASVPDSAVFVGVQPGVAERFPGVDLDLARPEEVLIACNGKDLLMAGRDRTLADQQIEFGTANAVYTFIEKHLGARWLWPGPLGLDIVEKDTIAFEPFEFRFAPPFRQRDVYTRESGDLRDWTRFQRNYLDSLGVSAGHAFGAWFDNYHEDHPEYFALQPDGTRSGYPRPRNAKLCLSNPGVWAQWLRNAEEDLERNPAKRVFNSAPNDSSSSGICICENCRAWDVSDATPWRLNWQGFAQEYVAMTDRYMTFSNQVGRLLKERFPDRDLWVSQMAYGPAKPPPVKTVLDDNIIVGYVGHFPIAGDSWREEEQATWRGWADKAPQLIFRPNIFYYSAGQHGIPTLAVQNTIEDFAFLASNRCVGITLDGTPHHFSPLAPQLYAMVKLAWDPLQDGEALMDEFYRRGFGEAAESVAGYYAVMEKAHLGILNWPMWRPSMGNIRNVAANIPKFYTPELLEEAERLLDEAGARVADGPDVHRERVAFVRLSLEYTRDHVRTIEAMNRVRASGGEDTAAVETAMELCEKRDAFFDRVGGVAYNPYRFNITWSRGRNMLDHVGPPKDAFLKKAGIQKVYRWTGSGETPIWSDPTNWEIQQENRWLNAEQAPGPMDVARLGDACADEPQNISLLRDARVGRIVLEATGERRGYAISSYEHGADDMLDADSGMVYRLFLTQETPLELASEATRTLALRVETVLAHEGAAAILLNSEDEARIVAERPIRTESHLLVRGNGEAGGGILEVRDQLLCGRLIIESEGTILPNTARPAFPASLNGRLGTILVPRDTETGAGLIQFGGTLKIRLFSAGDADATIVFGGLTRGGEIRLLPPADGSTGSLTMRATSIQSNAGLIQAPAIHLAENTFIDLLGDQEIPTTVERAAGIHGEGGLRKSQASGRGVRTVAVIGEKNTYTGGTFIEAGTLRLAKATIPEKDIPNPPETEYAGCLGPGPLRVSAGAAFDLDGQEQTVASLHGEGEILLNGGTLVVADPDASDFSGAVRGPGRLVEGTAEREIQ